MPTMGGNANGAARPKADGAGRHDERVGQASPRATLSLGRTANR